MIWVRGHHLNRTTINIKLLAARISSFTKLMIIRADLNLGRQGMKGLTLGRRFSVSTFFPLRKVPREKSFPFEVKVYAHRMSIA